MSKENESTVNIEELRKLSLAKLRTQAKSVYGLRVTPDLTSEELVAMIVEKTANPDTEILLDTDGDMPPPGRARIILQRDPNPTATNSPIFLNINGARILIKRGVEVDVPIKFLKGGLNNCVTTQYREVQNPAGGEPLYALEEVMDYPYQLIDINPGPDPLPGNEIAKMAKYKKQEAFRTKFGHWPRGADREALAKMFQL